MGAVPELRVSEGPARPGSSVNGLALQLPVNLVKPSYHMTRAQGPGCREVPEFPHANEKKLAVNTLKRLTTERNSRQQSKLQLSLIKRKHYYTAQLLQHKSNKHTHTCTTNNTRQCRNKQTQRIYAISYAKKPVDHMYLKVTKQSLQGTTQHHLRKSDISNHRIAQVIIKDKHQLDEPLKLMTVNITNNRYSPLI